MTGNLFSNLQVLMRDTDIDNALRIIENALHTILPRHNHTIKPGSQGASGQYIISVREGYYYWISVHHRDLIGNAQGEAPETLARIAAELSAEVGKPVIHMQLITLSSLNLSLYENGTLIDTIHNMPQDDADNTTVNATPEKWTPLLASGVTPDYLQSVLSQDPSIAREQIQDAKETLGNPLEALLGNMLGGNLMEQLFNATSQMIKAERGDSPAVDEALEDVRKRFNIKTPPDWSAIANNLAESMTIGTDNLYRDLAEAFGMDEEAVHLTGKDLHDLEGYFEDDELNEGVPIRLIYYAN